MLTTAALEAILKHIPRLTIGVLGDLFLDRYLELDATLTEPSLETGLDAYQVVRVRSSPGAAGTVINNLVALGVKRVRPVAAIGDDGDGYELRQALQRLGVVDLDGVFAWNGRRTPTYTKPMLHHAGRPPRELNRLDIKNRTPLPSEAEGRLIHELERIWPQLDALIVLDQVGEADCGVVTTRLRHWLTALAQRDRDFLILADSRERIGLFRDVWLKPNATECLRAVGQTVDLDAATHELANRVGRPVFCTRGEQGIVVADPRSPATPCRSVAAFPVAGPIDVVGAGDSASAGLGCAVASGATLEEAAAFANLVASITVRQIGTTGTASPVQVRQRWAEIIGAGV